MLLGFWSLLSAIGNFGRIDGSSKQSECQRHRPSAELIWEPCLTNRAQAELGGSWGHISSLLIPDFCFTLLRGTPFPFHSYLCCPTCHFPFYYIFFFLQFKKFKEVFWQKRLSLNPMPPLTNVKIDMIDQEEPRK